MAKRIVFFGNERLATGVTTEAWTLQALLKEDYEVAAVVVAQKNTGSSRSARPLEIVALAEKHHIPVLSPEKPADIMKELQACKADIGVLVAYGKIVPQSVIDIFPAGIVNIHPSLLPKHRGSTPIESAILNGDEETGVSLMKLTAEMDAGPVYAQKCLPISRMTKEFLANYLLMQGVELLLKHLPAIIDGSLQPIKQIDSEATYDSRIKKEDAVINWHKSAEQLERELRAYAGWPRSQTTIGGTQVIITEAKVVDNIGAPGTVKTDDGKLIVFCKWGALQIERLTPAGKKEMSAKAFLAGYSLV